jgi:Type VI secretion system/phage-baseplate injector OB domain
MSRDRGPTDRPQLEDLVRRARTELRDWTDVADSDPGVTLVELFAFLGEQLLSHSERLAAEAHLGGGRRNEIEVEVEVDGHPWHQVTDLAGSGAEDPDYLVSRRDDGASVIEFGDGVNGRRPPSNNSIGVHYRHGAGAYSSVLLQQGRVIIDTDVSEEPVRATCGVYRATVLDNADPLMQRRLLVQVPDVSGDEPVWAAACLPVPEIQEGPTVGDGVWIAFESCDPSRPIWLGQRITD